MNRIILLVSFLIALQFYSNAQYITTIRPLDNDERLKIKLMIAQYSDSLSSLLRKNETTGKKTSLFIAENYVSDSKIHVWGDYNMRENKLVEFFPYVKSMLAKEDSSMIFKYDYKKVFVGKLKEDKARDYKYVEVIIPKNFYKVIQVKMLKENPAYLQEDTVDDFGNPLPKKEPTYVTKDSLIFDYTEKRRWYLKVELARNKKLKSYKIMAETKDGKHPQLPAIAPNVVWWIKMDPYWKKYFDKIYNFNDPYPQAEKIEWIKGTKKIDLKGNKAVKSIKVLSKISRLEYLDISGTQVSDISGLKKNKYLKELYISNSMVKDFSPISNHKYLWKVEAENVGLDTLSYFASLPNLLVLNVAKNKIRSLEPLKNVKSLEKLNIELNEEITSIQPLSELTSLTELRIRKMKIEGFQPLKSLSELVVLDCFNCGMEDLSIVASLPKLMRLSLAHNKVSSLAPISNLKFLKELDISSTAISDMSTIKSFKYLESIALNNNPQINTLGPIHGLQFIKYLKAVNTKIPKGEIQKFKNKHFGAQITYY